MASLNEHTTVLGSKHARHLLRRATFGFTLADVEHFATLTPAEALAELVLDQPVPDPPVDTATGSSWVDPPTTPRAVEDVNSEQGTLHNYFKIWHFDQMLNSGMSIKERITYFFHTHLPARWTEINSSEAIYYQNTLYRYYALGNFKTLFKKICLDNAMLVYLDNATNHKDDPNENFAREMFELYSIGRGEQFMDGEDTSYTNYTENDIKAATRVLTGWVKDFTFTNLDADTGIPIGKLYSSDTIVADRHDAGTKTFSTSFAGQVIEPGDVQGGYATIEATEQEFDDLIEMIFAQKETARFICRKLYRFFVYFDINDEIESDIIEGLATTFVDNDYELLPVIEQLLKSQHFYDTDDAVTTNDNIGAIIKSPIEIYSHLMNFFEISLPDKSTALQTYYNDIDQVITGRFEELALNFYEPFEVAGYPAYHQFPAFQRNWITPTSLAQRYRTSEVLQGKDNNDSETIKIDILDWIENSGSISDPTDQNEIVSVLVENLLPVELNTERFNYFVNDVLLDSNNAYNWPMEWNNYVNNDDDFVVRTQLELLFTAIVQTPEFQLL
jgi:uncharacterized protein (DUF1800 family)